jgi:hypothetical protein
MSNNEVRQKIPVPRRSFLWSLNETSGEILTHVGPTEFTPSANDRIVRSNERGGFEMASMEARPFVVARDGEYVVLSNPISNEDSTNNGSWIAGGNKERELVSGTKRIIPGPASFPLWPGQSAEVRPAHKLGANQYLLVEVVGEVDDRAPYFALVIESAGLSSAVIDQGGEAETGPLSTLPRGDGSLRLGQRIVIQGRHTQLFIPPSGIEIVPPIEETESKDNDDTDASAQPISEEHVKLLATVKEGLTAKQFSTLKNELRHRSDLTLAQRAIILTSLDLAFEAQKGTAQKRVDRSMRSGPQDPYARRAVVLGPKEFCILFDADGNPRIVRGPARVFPGPHDTFLQRGSRRRVYDAYELAEHQALWLRVITPVTRDRLAKNLPPGTPLDVENYDAGAELIVRGRPSVFFPFIEAEVVNPTTREPHVGNDHDAVILEAIGIDRGSGVYVRDLRTGVVKMVRGETSYLVDPRTEEVVGKAASITIPVNQACMITSTSRSERRVEVGPKIVLLEHDEKLLELHLSKGASKDGHQTVATTFLQIEGWRLADMFELETSDFVKLRVKLGFAGRFEGEPETWFAAQDPVKLLADNIRAKLREVVRALPLSRVMREMSTIFVVENDLRFEENGMVVEACELLKLDIVDAALAELFANAQREAVKLQITDEQATRRLASERHQDSVDEEEHLIVRAAVVRKAESRVLDAESEQKVAMRKQRLENEVTNLALDDELRAATLRSDAALLRRQKEAEIEQTNRAKLVEIESARARAAAEAEAIRLAAIQPELVGALHSAADAEVMKAAASNMNLVSLLGGKSPSELLEHVLKGTPLERSVRDMRARSSSPETNGNGTQD